MRGSKYRKTDLQIHTPASGCYQESGVLPEQIVDQAIQQGLEVIAITDHNTTAFVDKVRAAAKGKPLHVFPGVEITSAGGHILAIFDRDCPVNELDDLLARVGILADMRGKKEALAKDAETVIREVDALGGIAIAAHANSNSGILDNPQGQLKIKLCSMPELSALELTNRKDVEKFVSGAVPGYLKKPCVQNSDAHSLAHIGQRFTYLKMDIVSLNGIRQALLDHEIKVKFAWHDVSSRSPRMARLIVSAGFFQGSAFDLHPHLNCFVGGKGTGKSTAIELLRYAFNDLSTFEEIKQDTLGKALSLVGAGATVSVHCVDELGQEFVVQRRVSDDHDEEPVCRDSAGEIVGIPFKPVFFSQGEIVRVASSRLAQMSLVDAYVDVVQPSQDEASATAQLERNAVELLQAEEKLANLRSEVDDPKVGKKVTAGDVKKLERALKEPVLKEFPKWEGEKRFVESRLDGLDQAQQMFESAVDAVDLEDLFGVELADDAPNAKALASLENVPSRVDALVKASVRQLRDGLIKLKGEAEKGAKQWQVKYAQQRKQYEQVIAASKEKSVPGLQAKLVRAKKRLDTLNKAEKDIERLHEKLKVLRAKRAELIAALAAARRAKFDLRLETAKRWEQQLGGKVGINIKHLGTREHYAGQMKELLEGSWVREKDQQTVVEALEPWKLVELVRADDLGGLTKVGVAEDPAKKMLAFLSQSPGELFALETVPLPDLPEITFEVEPGVFKPLNALSVGGKGTVVMLLAMVEGNTPLVIDQPEDSLDTLFIYEQIVRKVREQKETRQFIFATHNPNVLVSADADLSFVLEATADKGTIRTHGGMDRKDTNELLIVHLEGGEPAFKVRGMKYHRI